MSDKLFDFDSPDGMDVWTLYTVNSLYAFLSHLEVFLEEKSFYLSPGKASCDRVALPSLFNDP